jgi:hypothetical protein
VVDALSRKELPADSCLTISAAIPSWVIDVEASYVGDAKCVQLLQDLALDPASHPHYTMKAGLLRYKNRIVVGTTTDLKQRLFQAFHSSNFGGHSGQRVTYHRLKHIFHWPNMKQYIDD